MQKIVPCLWFDNQAEEAVNFYISLFKDARISNISRYDEASAKVSGQKAGSVLTVDFELAGQNFIALNGGPVFKFSEAVSLVINCKDQAEVDEFWEKLIADGGQESQCGWLKDKYGFSWQIVPIAFTEMMSSSDAQAVKRVMKAMLTMKKLDLAALEAAYQQK